MPALLKHLIPLLLVAGTMLGAASADAHSPLWSYYWWDHHQQTQTANMCAYECALVNHDVSKWKPCNGATEIASARTELNRLLHQSTPRRPARPDPFSTRGAMGRSSAKCPFHRTLE